MISEQYLALNRQLHRAPQGFGGSGWRWSGVLAAIVQRFEIRSMLDYGCGQSTLWSRFQQDFPELAAGIYYLEYDPAVDGKDCWPKEFVDLVTCTDVLEHVELAWLDKVLHQIFTTSLKVIFFNIALQPSNKKLPDGRNAHLIIQPGEWWLWKLSRVGWKSEILSSPRPEKDLNILMVDHFTHG